VTSPVGAVWQDIRNVVRRRYPLAELVLSPTVVQGDIAAPALVRALQRVYARPAIDVVILARGGGSLEDLWAFNDERVVRTIVAAPIPVVVGVGHESDVTLADFAADLRAPTPSAAAELAVPDGTQLPAILGRLRDRAMAGLGGRVEQRRRVLAQEGRALAGAAPDLGAARQRAGDLLDRGARALVGRVARERATLDGLQAGLRALGPAATLARGYAVARRPDGRIVRAPGEVAAGDPMEVVVQGGRLETRIESTTTQSAEELLG